MPYHIDLTTSARAHLRSLKAGQRSLILAAIHEQLTHEPTTETINRKPMRKNELANWELRVRNFRVYYSMKGPPEEMIVEVAAIGEKKGSRVFIGGVEWKP